MPSEAEKPSNPISCLAEAAIGALAHMDVSRLCDLESACKAIQARMSALDATERDRLSRQSRPMQREMIVFERVLAATCSNLQVLRSLETTQAGLLEYGPGRSASHS
jgi:hypothetical protein